MRQGIHQTYVAFNAERQSSTARPMSAFHLLRTLALGYMHLRMQHLSFAFLLFDRVTQLDLTGPVQVLSRAGDCTVQLVAKSTAPVMTDAGFAIVPTHTLEQVTEADVLCIPGGAGVDDAMLDAELVKWIRSVASRASWVTSVCTGSLVLGAAGLLQGKRATSHWSARELLSHFGALPDASRYVVDGSVITGGGVTAGIDFALALLALLRGEEHAKRVQLGLEYNPAPPFNCGSPDTADPQTLRAVMDLIAAARAARVEKVINAASRLSIA